MTELELITVSNGTNNYPGNFTNKELKIIKYNSKGKVLHLFSGKSKFGDVRVDYACKEATHNQDVFKFLKNNKVLKINKEFFNTIIIDAPYNQKFANKYQKLNNTPEQFIIFADAKKTTLLWDEIMKINPEIIILKSFNYYCLKRYNLGKGYVCYAGGYRKPTFLLVEIKEEDDA